MGFLPNAIYLWRILRVIHNTAPSRTGFIISNVFVELHTHTVETVIIHDKEKKNNNIGLELDGFSVNFISFIFAFSICFRYEIYSVRWSNCDFYCTHEYWWRFCCTQAAGYSPPPFLSLAIPILSAICQTPQQQKRSWKLVRPCTGRNKQFTCVYMLCLCVLCMIAVRLHIKHCNIWLCN